MPRTVEQILVAHLLGQLRTNILDQKPASAVDTLRLIEEVAGHDYRQWLMAQDIDDAVTQARTWPGHRSH